MCTNNPSIIQTTSNSLLRVAAYCRVSTEDEKQSISLTSQAQHWESCIKTHPTWVLAGIYVETGLSATHAETRPELMRLIQAAGEGEIDLIVTKSISRFSRNTVDCLSLVRTLSSLGVAVYFERENLNTGAMDSEFFLSILSSFAADESRSISQNVKWGYSKRFQRGVFKYKRPPYGYDASDGELVVNSSEAETVERIFTSILRGLTPTAIAADLNSRGISTKYGEADWSANTVLSIVRNITYTGDALFQKTVRDEAYRAMPNRGIEDQYYVADHHEPIIAREVYIIANERMGDSQIRVKLEEWQKEALAFTQAEDQGASGGVVVIKANASDELEERGKVLRVAAYCRVSTDSDEQENSYEAQCVHYQSLITAHPGWTLADIYADEGITGTTTAKRERFKQLMADCEEGKIDLILTKSISRFARNTLDCLTHIRRLKALGIAVEFEKEAINTLDAKGEVLITIMASIAQQESCSISQNVKLGIQYRFQQGKGIVNAKRLLGYDKTGTGRLVINPAQAAVVRRIFRLFLEGQSPTFIANTFRAEGVKTGCGGTSWPTSTVKYILTNEKYVGDLLMQKTYVANFLNHRSVKNDGKLPQYYVKDAHDPIVPRVIFEMAGDELYRRSADAKAGKDVGYGCREALKGRLFCACGARMVKGRWKVAQWTCPNCLTRSEDSAVKRAVLEAVNQLPRYRAAISEGLDAAVKAYAEQHGNYNRAMAAARVMKYRLTLEVIDQIEGRMPEAQNTRGCWDIEDFWIKTRHVRKPGPVTDWIDEDIIRLVGRVVVGDEVCVHFRCGLITPCHPDLCDV